MNLREDKHWAYGSVQLHEQYWGQRPAHAARRCRPTDRARSAAELLEGSAQGVFVASADRGRDPPKSKDSSVRSLPGGYETIGAVAGALTDNAPCTAARTCIGDPQAAHGSTRDTDDAGRRRTSSSRTRLTCWVIVGDLSKIEAGVRAEPGRVRVWSMPTASRWRRSKRSGQP